MKKSAKRQLDQSAQSEPEELSLRPWIEADDLTDWDVFADSESNGPMGFIVQVKIDSTLAPAVVRAAHEAGLDVTAFVQRAMDEFAQSLAEREPHTSPATPLR